MNTLINFCQKLLYLLVKMSPIFILVGIVLMLCIAITPLVIWVIKAAMYVVIPSVIVYFSYKYINQLTGWFQKINKRLDKFVDDDEQEKNENT